MILLLSAIMFVLAITSCDNIVFENIGEFDFVINKGLYDNLNANGILAEEFAKEIKSINQQD